MNVIAPRTLAEFWEQHPEAEEPLRHWLNHVQSKVYNNFSEVRADFRSADWVDGFIVFNIGGNKFRLIVRPNFAGRFRTFFVKFIGTHKQYDRLNWEEL